MAKRLASDMPPSVPPQKLAKRIHKMQLEPPEINDAMDSEMDGIESPEFYHVSRKDWLDAVNEIDVDDRFTRIPQEVRVKPYFERPTNALIRYTPKPEKPVMDADEMSAL